MLLWRQMETAVSEDTLQSEVCVETNPCTFRDNATELQRPTHQGVANDLPPQVAHQAQVPAEVFHGEESKDVPQDFAGQATDVALGLLAGQGPEQPKVGVGDEVGARILHLLARFFRLCREPRQRVPCSLPGVPGLCVGQGRPVPWGFFTNPVPLTGSCRLAALTLEGPGTLPCRQSRAWRSPSCFPIAFLRQGTATFCSKGHFVLGVLRAVLAHRIALGHVIGASLLTSWEELSAVSLTSLTCAENPNRTNEKGIRTAELLLAQTRQTKFQLPIPTGERDKDIVIGQMIL